MAKANKDDPPQHLKYLKLKSINNAAGSNMRFNMGGTGPCADQLAAVISCWRGQGVDAQGCADLVTMLTNCASGMQKTVSRVDPLTAANKTLAKYFKRYLQK